ncbi:MAG: FecR domain-containing protein [Sandaracinaceae bacterium]
MSTPTPLHDILPDSATEERLHRNWVAIAQRRERTRARGSHPGSGRPMRSVLAGGLLAAAAVVALALYARPAAEPVAGPLRGPDGAPWQSVEAARTVLSDGSTVELRTGADLEVLENSPSRLALVLSSGAARFEVTPGGSRRWQVDAGPVTVEVVGTVFAVTRAGPRVTVDVERGAVVVRSDLLADGARRVSAGESLTLEALPPSRGADVPVGPTAMTPPDVTAPPLDVAASPAEVAAPSPDGIAPAAPRSASRRSAGSGGRGAARRAPSAPQLRARADQARREGRVQDAVDALEEVMDRYPRQSSAALAAVTLGRIELRERGNPGRAAEAFTTALDLGVPGAVAEEVHVLRVEAFARAGRAAEARAAAVRYETTFPNGRRRDVVRRWVAGRLSSGETPGEAAR